MPSVSVSSTLSPVPWLHFQLPCLLKSVSLLRLLFSHPGFLCDTCLLLLCIPLVIQSPRSSPDFSICPPYLIPGFSSSIVPSLAPSSISLAQTLLGFLIKPSHFPFLSLALVPSVFESGAFFLSARVSTQESQRLQDKSKSWSQFWCLALSQQLQLHILSL